MITIGTIDRVLREKYKLVLGELSKRELKERLISGTHDCIKVRGRSCKTGKKKVVQIPHYDFV